MAASSFAVKTSGDVHGMNGTASGTRVNAALRTIDLDVSRAGVCANSRSDVIDFQTARSGVGFDRASNARNIFTARTARSPQLGAGWNFYLVADGDVASELRIVDVADTNVVSALLDGRIAFDLLNTLLGVSTAEHPFARINAASDFDLVGTPRANVDGAGTGFHLQVYSSGHIQRAIELAASRCG